MYKATVFNQIAEGMEVYDSDGVHIGTIEAFRLGEGSIKAGETDIITMSEKVSQTIGENKILPTAFYSRLYAEGFVYVRRGILRSDVLIFPDQIAAIEGNWIYLDVTLQDLLKV